MAETMRLGSDPQPDLEQLVMDAKNRWLRPAEICLILKNYRRFRIQSEPPNRPPSGAFFLFDKKLLRYFRKDGHQWRKKKDGKTVKEAHEKLKAGSVDVLHCYYAHGEEDDNFQRRSYWMLEEELMHIVFVHYRNVKGSKGSSSRTKDVNSSFYVTQEDALAGSQPMSIPHQVASMDADSPNSGQSSEYEDAENDNCQASSNCAADNSEARSRYAADNCSSGSRYNPFVEMPRNDIMFSANTSHLEPYVPVNPQAPTDDLQGCRGIESDFITLAQADLSVYGRDMGTGYNLPSTSNVSASTNFISNHDFGPSFLPHWPIYTDIDESVYKKDLSFGEISMVELIANPIAINGQDGTQYQMSHSGDGSICSTNMDAFVHQDFPVQMGKTMENSFVKHRPLELSKLEGYEGLKKNDSFSRWCIELEKIDASYMQSSSGICWDEVENGSADEDSSLSHHGHIDSYALSPSVSQDQLFSIVGFSPSWAYVGLKTKVCLRLFRSPLQNQK